MKNLLKEPLVQFLVIAVLLLGGERLFNADNYAYQQYRIDIDNSVLLQFLQLQAKMFNPADAQAALDRLSSEERQRLIEDYGRNEALFREGIALNLDKNDQIIRSRVIQKMDYLLQGFYDEAQPLTENDLRAYFAEHQQEYQKPATATFTHVFISTEKRSVDAAKAMAETLYTELNAQAVPFENAPRYGERFSTIATMLAVTTTKLTVISDVISKKQYSRYSLKSSGRDLSNLPTDGMWFC